MILAADRGPIGFAALWYLFGETAVRGMVSWDCWHVISGDIDASVRACGEWIVILEQLVVLNLPNGPWEGHAYFLAHKTGIIGDARHLR